MNMPFTVVIRVRYGECDQQGVVFNARYGDYINTAALEFLRVTLGGHNILEAFDLDSQTVRITTEWRSYVKYDDIADITVETVRVGNSSYTLGMRFLEHSSQRAVASSEIVCVMVDRTSLQKRQVPEEIRKGLLRNARGAIIDYSGLESMR